MPKKKEEVTDLTKLSKGDKIILLKSNNGLQNYEGNIFEITSRNNQYYCVKQDDIRGSWSIYFRSPADEFCLADRKAQAKYLRGKIAEMEKEIVSMKIEADRLENFESEEAYVAYKIETIFKAHKKGGVKAITEVLKTLKESHML